MANKTEGLHTGEFIVSEGNGAISREVVTLVSGQNLAAGSVLGKITVGAAAFAALGTNVGACTCGTITLSAGVMAGIYTIVMLATSATGAFVVEDPNGSVVGHGNVGSAFSAGGLAFTISNGGTNTVGDSYKITVAAGSGTYTMVAPAAADGSQVAVAVLYDNVDASGGDKKAVAIVRMAEVNASELNFAALDAGQITTAKAQLNAVGILVREAV